ncbi:unnamed protein product [Rhizophagus irregularis]|nr:unnamed protein product [Rhizophagus irregularis]
MVSKFHSSLSESLSLMLNDSDDHNVIIQVGENQNIKEFRAHSNILRARSPYFKGAFSTGWISKKDNMIEFKKPNISPTVFEMILKYIYTGEVDLTKQPGENILGLFTAISSPDFFDKVRPYKTVIPYHIYEEAMEFYMKNTSPKTTTLPPRSGNTGIESNLIKPKLTSIIAGWIERKNGKSPSLNKKYMFDLLYRSSQNGNNINTFRNKCNNQGACLVIVKHQQSAKIYGGYNPLGFMHSGVQFRNTAQ